MKVMKYSIQPGLFYQPLDDILEEFGNLAFLGDFGNLTESEQSSLSGRFKFNFNPRVFMCQYAREPKLMKQYNCDLFQVSLTNGGLGYSFNQANFWDLYSSTLYTNEFARIYKPKGFKLYNLDGHLDGKKEWRNLKDNIFYPVKSGPKNGLTVTISKYKKIICC